jgi:IMP dehydrogenase
MWAAASIEELHEKAQVCENHASPACKESHVHDVVITKEAPNYRVEKQLRHR